ncbi:MAG: hypothetical protein JW934_04930 [Anaerolineae bacterium]|nr:hypothetical protein [Anaerolineae bacterium]
MKLDHDMLKQMIRGVLNTHDRELDCGECFEYLDQFAELMLIGKDTTEAMPLVKEHLERCGNCREEFEALLAALRTIDR